MDLALYGVAIVPLIIALVQLTKGIVNPKYAGVLAWVIGVAIGLAYGLTEAGWTALQSIVVGSALGLTAAGLYSTQKNVRDKQ